MRVITKIKEHMPAQMDVWIEVHLADMEARIQKVGRKGNEWMDVKDLGNDSDIIDNYAFIIFFHLLYFYYHFCLFQL